MFPLDEVPKIGKFGKTGRRRDVIRKWEKEKYGVVYWYRVTVWDDEKGSSNR